MDDGFEYRQQLGIFLFTTASRPHLEPTQPPIQWVPGALSLGLKRPQCEADHSPSSSAEVKNACSYTSIPQYAFMVRCSVKVLKVKIIQWSDKPVFFDVIALQIKTFGA
jgi:hypothetical protein